MGEFPGKLTAGELPAEWEFRLPTETQWEYDYRTGTTTATSFGDNRLSSLKVLYSGQPDFDAFHVIRGG